MSRVASIGPDLVLIDTGYTHTPEAIAVYLLRGDPPALVETGPATTVDAVLAGVRDAGVDPQDLRAAAVTHIHLDHAGGAGALAERLPNLQIYVHPIGAPHLVDPARLTASARRLYGADLDRLLGEPLPIPGGRVHAVADGEILQMGARRLRAFDTPGHARHHHAFFDEQSGDLFTGDAAGVALPNSRYVRAPTPPPDFDVAAWKSSLTRMRGLRPSRLLLTHFGPQTWVPELLDQLSGRIDQLVEQVRAAIGNGLSPEAITARIKQDVRAEIDAADGAGSSARYEVIMPIYQSVLGAIRYIEKTGS
ncbi:MAG TPA: MBL fold metallo-hydrolase [bacterium]|nr:MBL fold metallo-hydrolase [bacterium]